MRVWLTVGCCCPKGLRSHNRRFFFRLHTAPHLLKEVGSASTTPCLRRTAVQLPCLSLAPLAEHQRLAQLPAELHVAVQPIEGEAQLGLQAIGGALAASRPAEGRLADRSSLLFEKKVSWSSASLLAPTPPQPRCTLLSVADLPISLRQPQLRIQVAAGKVNGRQGRLRRKVTATPGA